LKDPHLTVGVFRVSDYRIYRDVHARIL
jgi:hypothetical protein